MTSTFDIAAVRADFDILARLVHDGRPLVYLDAAASTQKPRQVLDAIREFDERHYSNVHRGAHALASEATAMFERSRERVAELLHARADEIIFTKGTTESVNLVAASWGRTFLQAGDVILVTEMEHHANIVPWQMIAAERGAEVRPVPITDEGTIDHDVLASMLDDRVRLLAVTHASNVLGTINDVASICAMARRRGIVTFVDGAQAVQHLDVDVTAIGCDFYAFSAHKLYGPTGIGVLYGRRAVLETMPPYQGGGSMIDRVSFAGTTYADVPMRFEAGTPNMEGVVGLAAAIDWFASIDAEARRMHEDDLLRHATEALLRIDGLRIIGTASAKVGIVSFVIDGTHPADVGILLDRMGIAIRVGHHCAQPLMQRYGVSATARASFCVHTTLEEIDHLAAGLTKAAEMLR